MEAFQLLVSKFSSGSSVEGEVGGIRGVAVVGA